MNSRERVLLAMNHKEPDRVPIWFGSIAASFIEKTYSNVADYLGFQYWRQPTSFFDSSKYDERIMKRMHSDLRFLINGAGGTNAWRPVKIYDDGTYIDGFNIRCKKVGDFSSNIIDHPMSRLKTVKEIVDYDQWVDNKAIVEHTADDIEEEAKSLKKKGEYAICGDIGWAHVELAAYLRGLDQWVMDVATRPEMAEALLKKLWDYQVPIIDKYLSVVGKYVDVTWTGTDYGMQTGLLMRPEQFRKYLKPWEKKKHDFIKDRTNGAPIVMHSCGSVYEIIPDLIETGIDGLNPLQPFAKNMEPERLKKEFGDKLFFVGGLDHQKIMTQEKKDIREFIDRLVRSYAPGGGYMFAPTHDIPPNISPEKILDAYDYMLEAGKYPISK
jgi:uroporphyrinogen decarboxylase